MIRKDVVERVRIEDRRERAGVAVILGVALAVLSGCSDLLDVDLPAQLGDAALEDPSGAEFQINSVIAHFENGLDDLLYEIHGREDVGEASVGGANRGDFQYEIYSDNFEDFAVSRRFAFLLHSKLVEDWDVQAVPKRAQFLAITSLYAGASLAWMGSSLCEATIDGGPLLTSAETLAEAETWLTQALSEIAAAGDFAMPHGIASSAEAMAYGLRAQVHWMAGDNQLALADAQRVPNGFAAYVTREDTPERDNTTWFQARSFQSSIMYDVDDEWTGPPNPVTGQPWASPLPFTGWINLGILPDGRVVREDGLPIRTEGLYTTAEELAAAVDDPRVDTYFSELILGYGTGHIMHRYKGGGDPIPIVNWKEMVLIRAEAEGGQTAIDLVNELRAVDNQQNGWNVPMLTYVDPANAQQIRYMIIEERRRALFNEGRYFYTKLKNTDLLWFPRNVGAMRIAGNPYFGGVRYLMPQDEFDLNENLSLTNRGTGCPEGQRPVQF